MRSGGSVIALASAMVEQVLRLKADALAAHYEKQRRSSSRTAPTRCIPCSSCSAQRRDRELQPYNSVLLLRSGMQRVAVHVDELLGNQEIVVKSIGPQLARVPGVSRRHGARRRQHRADHEPRAACPAHGQRAAPSTVRASSPTAAKAARAGGHGGRRLADRAQDHRPPARARRLPRASRPRTASTPSSRWQKRCPR